MKIALSVIRSTEAPAFLSTLIFFALAITSQHEIGLTKFHIIDEGIDEKQNTKKAEQRLRLLHCSSLLESKGANHPAIHLV